MTLKILSELVYTKEEEKTSARNQMNRKKSKDFGSDKKYNYFHSFKIYIQRLSVKLGYFFFVRHLIFFPEINNICSFKVWVESWHSGYDPSSVFVGG